jgi:hypothetical protein
LFTMGKMDRPTTMKTEEIWNRWYPVVVAADYDGETDDMLMVLRHLCVSPPVCKPLITFEAADGLHKTWCIIHCVTTQPSSRESFLCACCERIHGNGGTAISMLTLGSRRKWVVSFMSWLLYLREKGPWCPTASPDISEKRKIFCPRQEFNTLNNENLGLFQACH